MYPDLSYVFHALLGTEPDNILSVFKTFGFFLLLAFLAAAALLKHDLRRRERIGQLKGKVVERMPGGTVTVWDYVFNGIFGFVLGYKIPFVVSNLGRFREDAGSVLLTSNGWWWTGLLGGALFAGYYYYLGTKQQASGMQKYTVYPSDRVGPITMVAALGGILGAKFFAIIEYLPRFFNDPIGVLLSGDGLAIYGGLIGGAAGVMLYARSHKIKVLPLADAVAPGLIVGYGVGRMGCQFSGDGDWGIVAGAQPDWWFLPDWAWSFTFPHNVLNRGVPIPGCTFEFCTELPQGVYPTSIYEVIMAFTIGAALWALRKRLTNLPGLLFCVYLFLNGVERFFIEFIRVNDRYDVLGFALSQAQLIAVGFMVSGALLGYLAWRRGTVVN
ncbi:prolipoprotein diacylglyceryl transferase [Neolewinella antarctica]|uniref:Phosphatidylglycerol:prolipoprotein diacylglycerol transferase n=1 Tax=Neolewinella antarctica TaxID=442734 RepID=A0ABX0XEA7_9BACT|nr:prolipoprotein diacylglyceryl transferase family protein [Neolewinella antarctica]NJC27552.1 phosphatidylglycerol:prolipoprotein diacylglycerol transferase [Neolewinella antarctica]